MTDLADGAIFVVGGDLDDNGRSTGSISFVMEFFYMAALEFASAAHNGALDVIGGHAHCLGGGDSRSKACIGIDVAAAARGDHDFLNQAGEHLPAFGVEGSLFM